MAAREPPPSRAKQQPAGRRRRHGLKANQQARSYTAPVKTPLCGNGVGSQSLNRSSSQELVLVPVSDISPAPENDEIYGVVSPDDPEVRELARSINQVGLKDPLLISQDRFIISGHRRWVAAQLVGLKDVPVRIEPLSRAENAGI
jgi:hypothetical protein